jgi:hypothetical protein
MGRTTGLLQKGYTAGAAIRANRILTWGAADGLVIEATGAAAALVGIQSQLDCDSGDRASAAMVGNIEDVIYGGNVARGDPLTSDGQGRAIKATGAAGTLLNCIGFAEVSGVVGDIGTAIIAPFVMQGA